MDIEFFADIIAMKEDGSRADIQHFSDLLAIFARLNQIRHLNLHGGKDRIR